MSDNSTRRGWDLRAHQTRIARTGVRYEAGSPNKEEIAQYRVCLSSGTDSQTNIRKQVLVLGMTPELRCMVLKTGCHLISIDSSKDSIDLYRDWVPETLREKEKIVCSDWMHAYQNIGEPVNAVLGDGVFGNILSIQGHRDLLNRITEIINDNGVIVTRQAILPDNFDTSEHTATLLIEKYRENLISKAEFGFSMRLWGSYEQAYDKKSYILDNRIVFNRYQKWLEDNTLTREEMDCINRYYFDGLNMILPQMIWEDLLQECGLFHTHYQLNGNMWYEYYPLYSCHK